MTAISASAVCGSPCTLANLQLRSRVLPFTAASRASNRLQCHCQQQMRPSEPTSSPVHQAFRAAGTFLSGFALSAALFTGGAQARMEGVNKPELLPKGEFTTVIDIPGFLTDGEEKRIKAEIAHLEEDTGIKLRLLCQNYPNTPGLAIKDYWGVDDSTVVFVADPNTGNILNFNVGANLDLDVPSRFWTALAGKYGNKFYWQDNGQEAAVVNAVSAIDSCIREPQGRFKCSKIQEPMDKF